MARTDAQLNIRLPAELKARLEKAADENKRSMTAEVVSRLDAGMPANVTLRDYFAAKCMAAMLCNPNKDGANCGASGVASLSAFAYEYADAMLAERAR